MLFPGFYEWLCSSDPETLAAWLGGSGFMSQARSGFLSRGTVAVLVVT